MRGVLALLLALAAIGPARAEPPPPIQHAEGIVLLRDENRMLQPIAGTRFPLSPEKTCFGWRIVLAERRDRVSVRELYLLPGPATTWGYNPSLTTIAEDSASAVTVVEQTPLLGRLLSHTWCITEGDPLGFYRFQVSLNGVLAREFCFEAVAPEDFMEDPSTSSTGCAAMLS